MFTPVNAFAISNSTNSAINGKTKLVMSTIIYTEEAVIKQRK